MRRLNLGGIWPSTNRTRLRRVGWFIIGLAIVALCFAVRHQTGPRDATAQAPAAAPTAEAPAPNAPTGPAKPTDVVAIVNGERITQADLANEAMQQQGRDVLESIVNKTLISDYCTQHNIVITRQMVDDEITKVAQRFMIDRKDWMTMLQKERGISPIQYAEDIIWPTVALRLIAAGEIQPNAQEVQEAYETQFGPAVQCRLIALNDLPTAQKVREQAAAAPDEFGNLAKRFSVDVNSASAKGLIQPIRRHLGDKGIEETAFAMRQGDVSQIIPVHTQFVILKCENHLPGRNVPLEQVRPLLEDAIRDKKLRMTSTQIFERLQAAAQTEMICFDPAKAAAQPGVAARVNGRVLSVDILAQECVKRHGATVLESMIARRLMEQAVKKANLHISQDDINAEVASIALAMGKTKTPGGADPDVEGWIKQVTESQKITVENYFRDTVWPSTVLKKLVVDHVRVTDEDLKKGFEANYGPRVKCRAIVVNQLRKAQEVWEMARDNPSVEHFGVLAEQYSIDSVSRTLKGEVPPIQRHGGQPQMEREAFALQPGELSGIIQVGDNYVILLCEGQTQPRPIEFAAVRDLIYADVYEKKLQVEMSREYERMQAAAQIDNFIAGTVRSPTLGKTADEAAAAAQGRAVQTNFQAPAQR
jgi:parvulin-like peptidyl-prolyl isomerase